MTEWKKIVYLDEKKGIICQECINDMIASVPIILAGEASLFLPYLFYAGKVQEYVKQEAERLAAFGYYPPFTHYAHIDDFLGRTK